MAYTVKKIDGQYRAVDESGRVQFSSLKRINAVQWCENNNPKQPQETQQETGKPQQAT